MALRRFFAGKFDLRGLGRRKQGGRKVGAGGAPPHLKRRGEGGGVSPPAWERACLSHQKRKGGHDVVTIPGRLEVVETLRM